MELMELIGFLLIAFSVLNLMQYYGTWKPHRRFIKGYPWFNWPLLIWSVFWTFIWPTLKG